MLGISPLHVYKANPTKQPEDTHKKKLVSSDRGGLPKNRGPIIVAKYCNYDKVGPSLHVVLAPMKDCL